MKKIVLLLSGGLDTTTLCALAYQQDKEIYAVTIDYGQRNHQEINAAIKTAKKYNCSEHIILSAPFQKIGGAYLVDKNIAVNESIIPDKFTGCTDCYVPARNAVFLSLALAIAETRDCSEIWIGCTKTDNCPDCTPEFLEAFEQMGVYATLRGSKGQRIKIVAPLINLEKYEVIKLADKLRVDFLNTVSCYKANDEGVSCGKCEACQIKKRAFKQAGIKDPIPYLDEQ